MKQIVHSEDDFFLQCMRAIGYKEWQQHFYGDASINEVSELIKKNSRHFAKRQYTWFNNQMDVHWYDIKEENWKEKCIKDVETWMKQ